jgi:hypothetical protein
MAICFAAFFVQSNKNNNNNNNNKETGTNNKERASRQTHAQGNSKNYEGKQHRNKT